MDTASRALKSWPTPSPAYRPSRGVAAGRELRGGRFGRCRSRFAASWLDAAFKAADLRNLPGRPDGKHVVADLMAHYFRSTRRQRPCYNARIGTNTTVPFA